MEADTTIACTPDEATRFIWLNVLRLKVAAEGYGKKNSHHLRKA